MNEFITKAVKTVLEDLTGTSIINNALIAENPENQDVTENAEESPELLNRALRDGFNSADELKSKKLMAIALHIAKAKGLAEGIEAQAIAPMVDEGTSRTKAEYQVGEGYIDPYEAADKMIDQAIARTVTILEMAAPKYISIGVDALANVIATAYPPAATAVSFVKEPLKLILSSVAQKAIKIGLTKIRTVAKSAVRTIVGKAKSYATEILKKYALP